MRFNEEEDKAGGESSKPKGKAAKKRALADKLGEAEALFDNEEEELLFQVCFDGRTFVYLLIAGNDRRFHLFPIPCALRRRETEQVPCCSPERNYISAISPRLPVDSSAAFRVL